MSSRIPLAKVLRSGLLAGALLWLGARYAWKATRIWQPVEAAPVLLKQGQVHSPQFEINVGGSYEIGIAPSESWQQLEYSFEPSMEWQWSVSRDGETIAQGRRVPVGGYVGTFDAPSGRYVLHLTPGRIPLPLVPTSVSIWNGEQHERRRINVSLTLTQLLSNQSGLACNEHDRSSPGSEVHLFETADWAKAFVDLPVLDDPGTAARYCSGGFFAAGRIVERAAGKPLPEFADEVLFKPLAMKRADWRWNFALDRSQRNEFGQIYLRPRDMLKLGILIQNRGKWKDRRVVSTSWINAAVGHQSHVDDSEYGLGIWHRWYGLQTLSGYRRVDTIMLSGNGGQKVYLVPSLDLIVVSTGNAFFVDSPVNQMMARVLLPALLDAKPPEQRRPNDR